MKSVYLPLKKKTCILPYYLYYACVFLYLLSGTRRWGLGYLQSCRRGDSVCPPGAGGSPASRVCRVRANVQCLACMGHYQGRQIPAGCPEKSYSRPEPAGRHVSGRGLWVSIDKGQQRGEDIGYASSKW